MSILDTDLEITGQKLLDAGWDWDSYNKVYVFNLYNIGMIISTFEIDSPPHNMPHIMNAEIHPLYGYNFDWLRNKPSYQLKVRYYYMGGHSGYVNHESIIVKDINEISLHLHRYKEKLIQAGILPMYLNKKL